MIAAPIYTHNSFPHMDIALVTGAGSGLGLAITRKLIELGLKVYGLGGQYDEARFSHEYFVPIPCNMADMDEVRSKVGEIIKREGDNIYVVVNNAKLYQNKTLAETSDAEIEAVLKVNLLCPILLTRLALPSLTRLGGFVINIVANTAENSKGGAIGAATAGGLRWMGEALFEQLREDGVKVCSVFPQINKWRPDGSAPVQQRPQSSIDTEAVAEAVGSIVLNRYGNVVTDLVIRPQRLAEKPVPAAFVVPYPKPQPLPRTAPRETEAHVSLSETRAEMRRESVLVRKLLERADVAPDEDDVSSEKSEAPAPSYEKIAEERRDGEDTPDESEDDADERDYAVDSDERPFHEDASESDDEASDEEQPSQPQGVRSSGAERQYSDRQDDLRHNNHRRGRRGGRNRHGDATDGLPQPKSAAPASQNTSRDELPPVKNSLAKGAKAETVAGGEEPRIKPYNNDKSRALPEEKDEIFERETRPSRKENEESEGREMRDEPRRQSEPVQQNAFQGKPSATAKAQPAQPILQGNPAHRHNRRNRRPGSIMPVVASDGTILKSYAATLVRAVPVIQPRLNKPQPQKSVPVRQNAAIAPRASVPARVEGKTTSVIQPARGKSENVPSQPKPVPVKETARPVEKKPAPAPVQEKAPTPSSSPVRAAKSAEPASPEKPKRARKPRTPKAPEDGKAPVKRPRKSSSRTKAVKTAPASSEAVAGPNDQQSGKA
jgi:NAD(P)-dependent dehydrogenase (short-subunit alcohol dehydrogenase family)